MSSQPLNSTNTRSTNGLEYRQATLSQYGKIPSTSRPVGSSGYFVVLIPTDHVVPRSATIRGSSHVAECGKVSATSESTETAVVGNHGSAAVSDSLQLTAVVQVSSNEDDVLEIYAEELDRETVELINRF